MSTRIAALEAELNRAIAAATVAQQRLSAARTQADLPDRQAFFTQAEVRAIRREKAAEFRECIPIIMDAARRTPGPYAKLAAAAANAVPATRAQLAWVDTLALASEISKAAARGETPSVEMANEFLKAHAAASSNNVVKMPDLAQRIVAAGRKARNEP
jgi:hypothetical protein